MHLLKIIVILNNRNVLIYLIGLHVHAVYAAGYITSSENRCDEKKLFLAMLLDHIMSQFTLQCRNSLHYIKGV